MHVAGASAAVNRSNMSSSKTTTCSNSSSRPCSWLSHQSSSSVPSSQQPNRDHHASGGSLLDIADTPTEQQSHIPASGTTTIQEETGVMPRPTIPPQEIAENDNSKSTRASLSDAHGAGRHSGGSGGRKKRSPISTSRENSIRKESAPYNDTLTDPPRADNNKNKSTASPSPVTKHRIHQVYNVHCLSKHAPTMYY